MSNTAVSGEWNGAIYFEIAQKAIEAAPRRIPIFSHRYLPAEPSESGNPVFSIYHTDIIYYGNDLATYFHNEFGAPLPAWAAHEPRPIRFWDSSLDW